jgi:hypothetical protein
MAKRHLEVRILSPQAFVRVWPPLLDVLLVPIATQ